MHILCDGHQDPTTGFSENDSFPSPTDFTRNSFKTLFLVKYAIKRTQYTHESTGADKCRFQCISLMSRYTICVKDIEIKALDSEKITHSRLI